METPKVAATEKTHRVIKRYSNRKLYDTRDSRYVTLQQIGEMVRAGEEVQIIDNKTKEDKTEVTLALILSEDLKAQPRSVPLGALRELIQERGGKLLSQLRDGPIGRLIPGAPPSGTTLETEAPIEIPEPAPSASTQEKAAKGRLSELMESSLSSIEERIRGLKAFRDLESEVQRLSQRVETLEKRLGERQDRDKLAK